MTDTRLLTTKDLAALLRTSESNVRMMRSRKQLPPALKIGGRVRWERTTIDAWLLAHRETEPARGTLYVNRCPNNAGHVIMCDQSGARIDTAAGPRDAMVRIYQASGWIVVDNLPAD